MTAFAGPLQRMRLVLVPLFVVIGLISVGCGASTSGAQVRSIDAILASEIEIVELTARSASVRVTTRIPVVCSVVFGVDQSYGNQSTDLDMAGRAHSEHHAPLRGLEPDTIYHYRLQGTGSDGTLFASEDLTFRTPPAEEDDDDLGTNLATLAAGAQVIDSSSTFGSGATWGPENAIDDDPRTEWSSATDGNAAFIEIELASTTAIRAVGLWTRTMGATAQIIEFRVVTGDGVVLGPFTLPDANQLYRFEVEAQARVVRFEVVDSSGGNTGAVEVAVFGEAVE